MAEKTRVSMLELNEYVDGRLDPERRRRVEALLIRDLSFAATVRSFRQQMKQLHRRYDPVLQEPIPTRLIQAAYRSKE